MAVFDKISIFQYMFNKMQCYTLYFIWKLLYMFRVVPPLVRSANYLPLAAGSSNGWFYHTKVIMMHGHLNVKVCEVRCC
jgi:hypothetical protein